jgi:hypothetical protein
MRLSKQHYAKNTTAVLPNKQSFCFSINAIGALMTDKTTFARREQQFILLCFDLSHL